LPAPSQRLRPAERLSKRSDIQRVFRRGARSEGRYIVAIGLRTERALSRLGLAVGRGVGPAVDRNRGKRRLRACFRARKPGPPSLDLILVGRPGLLAASFADLCREYERCVLAIVEERAGRRRRPAARG
jgi:ribonuclease P protein component